MKAQKWILILLSITFLLLASNFFTGVKLTGHFLRREAIQRANPIEHIFGERLKTWNKKSKYLLIGDSRMNQWNPLLSKDIFNLGVNSATTTEIVNSVENLPGGLEVEFAFIQCGINDIKSLPYSGLPKETVINNCIRNIKHIVSLLKQKGVKNVTVLGVFPTGEISYLRKPFWNEHIEESRKIINHQLSLSQEDYKFLKLDSVLGNKSLYRDELHLSKEGYVTLNAFLLNQ